MTAAAIPAGRGLDAPDDCRRCAPAQGADRAPDPQGAPMPEQTTQLGSRTALALNIPIDDAREQQLDALWAMSSTERVAAMWRGYLTLYQLSRWSSRAQDEVPLLGGEFAWIVMRTPEWAEVADDLADNVIYLTEGRTTVQPHDDQPIQAILTRLRSWTSSSWSGSTAYATTIPPSPKHPCSKTTTGVNGKPRSTCSPAVTKHGRR